MQPLMLLALAATVSGRSFSMRAYSPQQSLHNKDIQAHHHAFKVTSDRPTTHCAAVRGMTCPEGDKTLVYDELKGLAVEAPGGQTIYVGPDGLVSYTYPHSMHQPPGSEEGHFTQHETPGVGLLVTWPNGLYVCPEDDEALEKGAVLYAGREGFEKDKCLEIEGILLTDCGEEKGAWSYN